MAACFGAQVSELETFEVHSFADVSGLMAQVPFSYPPPPGSPPGRPQYLNPPYTPSRTSAASWR
eukprot:611007-Rhodomonas_salina.1